MQPEIERWQILFKRVQELPRDVYNYKKMDIDSVDDFTDKAFLLSFDDYSSWIPAWTLRKDKNNNVWILRKFYDSKTAELTRMKAAGKQWWEVKR